MTVTEAIRARRSIRRYKDAEVTDGQLKQLLEAAMMAPSARNSRPWEFVVVRDRAKLGALSDAHPYAKMLRQAAAAIVVCALPEKQSAGTEFYQQDCGAATQNILLQAVELGLGTCWCGVYPNEDRVGPVRSILGIGREVVPVSLIAVGVPGEAPPAKGFYDGSKVRFV